MGQIKPIAFLVATALFLCISVAVFLKPAGRIGVEKEQRIASALSSMGDWHVTSLVPLQSEIIDALKLDDYLYQNYRSRDRFVSLYIGYYLTTKKVGAAHDPLVCLPGQGWLIKEKGRGTLELDGVDGGGSLSYATMIVERNAEKEFFLYWFQAYDKAVPDTLLQKFVSLTNRLKGLGQDNAFVRLSCSMNGRTEQECERELIDFVRVFYPRFLQYILTGR